jgi:hypothetical protein
MPIQTLTTPNGAVALLSSRQMLAGQGKAFAATNPTPGTAIAYANKTSYSATANGLFSIYNGNAVGGPNIYLDRLKLIQTATAPTGGLYPRFEIFTETGNVALTGAALAVTPVNLLNGPGAASTFATVTFFSAGAGTVAAAVGTRRIAYIGSVATGVNVQYDSWTFAFGSEDIAGGTTPLTAARATAPADLVVGCPAIVVAPQSSVWMNLWGITPAANTPSYEFDLTYFEV